METNLPNTSNKALAFIVVIILCIVAVAVVSYDVFLYTNMKNKAHVVLYPGPSGMPAASDRVITVDNKPVFVYDTAVNMTRSWAQNPKTETTPVAYFDFSGTVNIKVKVPGTNINSVTIRPLSLGIKPTISGDTISFKLSQPEKLTIEVNNDLHRALHLFTNPLEVNPPKKGDPGVHYFGPGVHKAGMIDVKSNETVYIAGGAVVYGWIKGVNLENVKIMGRGIIDGSIYDRWKDTIVPIDFEHCKDCTIDGISILDPAAWTLNTYFCQNITINNVKIISARSNGDGITTQSCTNLKATDCFVRGWDDNLVVKGYDGDVKDITFDNVILWTDLAQSCEIGYETRANTIENINFKNITVLHNFHKPVMSIHNSDNALVKNVHYDNVVVEDAQMGQGDGANFLIDLTVQESQWSGVPQRGNIRDIFFNNITVLGGNFPVSRIAGCADDHTIQNVNINNLKILGKDITDLKTGRFYVNDYVNNDTKNIIFTNK